MQRTVSAVPSSASSNGRTSVNVARLRGKSESTNDNASAANSSRLARSRDLARRFRKRGPAEVTAILGMEARGTMASLTNSGAAGTTAVRDDEKRERIV